MAKAAPAPPPEAMDPSLMAAIGLAGVVILIVLYKLLLAGPSKAKFLNKQRQQLTLGERVNLSHDTVRFRFTLPKSTPVLGLPVGKHFKLYCPNPKGKVAGQWNGREDNEAGEPEIERKYTPTSSDDDIGFVDLVIKVYKGGVIDRFPDGGKMSQYMDTLKVGDKLDIMGPIGTHEYLGKGKFKSGGKEHTCKKVGMMSGGTGITPMLQVMAAILKDPSDTTQISLIYANQTEADILCRDMLDDLAAKHPQRLKVWYTVDRAPANWKYSEGFITETMIAEHLPGPKESTLILMCGPPPMVKFACMQNLDKLGYPKSMQVAF
jgi:cytochrome-b5 reductase